jgi:hypothetical protein
MALIELRRILFVFSLEEVKGVVSRYCSVVLTGRVKIHSCEFFSSFKNCIDVLIENEV